jgi:tetratricopeptide (TPR) repeat protein
MSRIFGDIAQVVSKYEGFVEKFIGDAVMVLFGVPKAHEDDPVRAIRAAGEINDLAEALSPQLEEKVGKPLSMHSGINTGLVVTGEVDLDKGTHGVAGDTINLAARLCSLANPGEIVVGPDTCRRAEGHFTFTALGPTEVKGKAEPVQAYRVESLREQPRKIHRLQGLRADLIGRNLQMAELVEAVEKLRRGEGSVIAISGDAGTGKSRLMEEFKSTLDLDEIQWREGHAYAYSQNIPYFPLIDMLNRTWHIEEGDPPETVRKKVESSVEYLIGKKEDVIPYIGSLYALRYPEIERVDPEFWRIRLHQAIREILSALAERAPTIVCLEDLHWADPSSLDLLRFILSEFRHPALFVLVYRPYFTLFTSHQLSTLDKSYEEIRLHDLSASEAQDMTASLLKTKTIPSDLRRFVEERVEGNPFYLEEVINSLIESEILVRDNGTWKLTRSISESGISPTIHGVISGRLDRLEKETKRILQEASVIGRAFFYEILKRVTDLKEQIDECLSGLERLDLIRTRSLQPELEYIFKHALTQEVVYEGLLKKERRAIHERIGLVMEQLFQDRLPEFYENLAFHFKQGLSILKAVHYLMKSGEKSLKKYAVEESHLYYKAAFDLLAKKPVKTKEEKEILIDLIIEWALVFHFRGDFKRLDDLFRAHEGLAESLDDKARLGRLYVWLGMAAFCRARHRNAYQYLHKALKLGEETENMQVIGHACGWLPWVCAELGLFEEGISFGERAQEIARLLPPDPWLQWVSLSGLGYSYSHKGETKKVFKYGKDLLDHGDRHSDMRSLMWGKVITGLAYLGDGNLQSAIQCFREGLQISQDPYYHQLVRSGLGSAYAYAGQFQEAEEALQQVVAYTREYGTEEIGIPASMRLGGALIGKGHMGRGLAMIEEAQGLFLENEQKSFYAISEYILGKVYLQIAERATPMTLSTIAKNIGFLIRNVPFASKKAEYHFNKAIEVAKEIGAKRTLGQTYLDLGLLHKAKGRRDQARECISTSIELFEQCEAEGYLKQAKEALELL